MIKLILQLKFGKIIQKKIPYTPLDRNRPSHIDLSNSRQYLRNFHSVCNSVHENGGMPNTFQLKRSGRVMRSLHHDASTSNATWNFSNVNAFLVSLTTNLDNINTVGEMIHILRPLVHLAAMAKYGKKAWTPFFVSLGMDLVSLRLLNQPSFHLRTSQQRLELNKRTIFLLFYVLRSPFFDNYSKIRLLKLLGFCSDKIPIIGSLIRPMITYLPEWQQNYFSIWAS